MSEPTEMGVVAGADEGVTCIYNEALGRRGLGGSC